MVKPTIDHPSLLLFPKNRGLAAADVACQAFRRKIRRKVVKGKEFESSIYIPLPEDLDDWLKKQVYLSFFFFVKKRLSNTSGNLGDLRVKDLTPTTGSMNIYIYILDPCTYGIVISIAVKC